MEVRLMVTNGGPHPAEKHADMTAWKIVDLIRISDAPIDPAMDPVDRAAIEGAREAARQAKAALEPAIAAILVEHHTHVQKSERAEIEKVGDEIFTEVATPADHIEVDAVLAEVSAVFAGSMFAAHFAKPEAQARLVEIIAQDFATSMEIERSWHADRNPDSEACQAYRQAKNDALAETMMAAEQA